MSDLLPDFLPGGKTRIYIKTRGFPGSQKPEAEYRFEISCWKFPAELSIPGIPSGRDYCAPSFIEQDKWLDELAEDAETGIKRVWDCLWSIEDEATLRMFLRRLEPFRIETSYY